jgi:3-hydroxyisobutyrate dehydrogenase-like beta-hydroxyacid dehydrogenase
MATIGFIGLGIMGAHMARNLIKGGHKLVVNGKYPVPDDIRAQTQVVADSTAVAQESEIVITMVPDTPDVANVLFADDGVAKGLTKGKLVIDMSSIARSTRRSSRRRSTRSAATISTRRCPAAKSARVKRRSRSWSAVPRTRSRSQSLCSN